MVELEYTVGLSPTAHCEIESPNLSVPTNIGDVSLMVRHLFAKQGVDVNSVVWVQVPSSPRSTKQATFTWCGMF